MKKIAVLLLVVGIFFANSSPILGCESCEKLQNLGYYNGQVRDFITNGAAANNEVRARQMLYLFEHKYSARQVNIILGMAGAERRLQLIIPAASARQVVEAQQQVASIAEVRLQQTPWTAPAKSNTDEQVQVIETTMGDATVLLAPMEKQAQSVQKEVAVTNQQVKQVEQKKQYRKQKYVDAGVTTTAIISGLAIPPPIGPIVAAGVILSRVGWGLFQSDPNDE